MGTGVQLYPVPPQDPESSKAEGKKKGEKRLSLMQVKKGNF